MSFQALRKENNADIPRGNSNPQIENKPTECPKTKKDKMNNDGSQSIT